MKRALLFLGDDLGGGGAERAMVDIIRWFRRTRPETPLRLLLLKRRGVFLDAIPADVPIEELGGRGPYPIRNATRVIVLARRLRRYPGAMLVSFMHHMNHLAFLAARMAPAVRVVGVEQCAVGVSHATGRLRRVGAAERIFFSWLSRRAARLIVTSTGIREELAGSIDEALSERCVVIPNPVDLPPLTVVSDPARFVFLFSGRLVEQKNPRLLLEAFAETRKRLVDGAIALRIVGDGPLRAELERLAATLGIASAVEWRGFLKTPWSAMAGCDALILPSNFEGFGNVLVEALGLGLPVVTTDCPHGPRDIVAPDPRLGLLTPVGDLEALVAAMMRMVKERKQWRESGDFRREYARRFSIETIGPLYERVLLP
jgi:glycosyltransferase involved in cell wall biosynthesis